MKSGDGDAPAIIFWKNSADSPLKHTRYMTAPGPSGGTVLAQEDDGNEGAYRWLMQDYQGSTAYLADKDGTPTNHVLYDARGQILTSSTNGLTRYGYTGTEYDEETKLQYNRARYYDGYSGRFISQDPIGFAGGDSNLYRYANNDSINGVDRSGHKAFYKKITDDILGIDGSGGLGGMFKGAGHWLGDTLTDFGSSFSKMTGIDSFNMPMGVGSVGFGEGYFQIGVGPEQFEVQMRLTKQQDGDVDTDVGFRSAQPIPIWVTEFFVTPSVSYMGGEWNAGVSVSYGPENGPYTVSASYNWSSTGRQSVGVGGSYYGATASYTYGWGGGAPPSHTVFVGYTLPGQADTRTPSPYSIGLSVTHYEGGGTSYSVNAGYDLRELGRHGVGTRVYYDDFGNRREGPVYYLYDNNPLGWAARLRDKPLLDLTFGSRNTSYPLHSSSSVEGPDGTVGIMPAGPVYLQADSAIKTRAPVWEAGAYPDIDPARRPEGGGAYLPNSTNDNGEPLYYAQPNGDLLYEVRYASGVGRIVFKDVVGNMWERQLYPDLGGEQRLLEVSSYGIPKGKNDPFVGAAQAIDAIVGRYREYQATVGTIGAIFQAGIDLVTDVAPVIGQISSGYTVVTGKSFTQQGVSASRAMAGGNLLVGAGLYTLNAWKVAKGSLEGYAFIRAAGGLGNQNALFKAALQPYNNEGITLAGRAV